MKARSILILAAAAPLALTACSPERPRERPAVAPAAAIVGEAQSCIPLTQISSTRIRDDWTIDFMGPGDRVWRNTMANRCPGLKSDDAFTYSTSISQLCSSDIIYVLRTTAGRPERGAGCGLGQFVPVSLEK